MQLSRVSQGAESHGRAPLPQMPPGPTSRERPFWAGHLGEPQAKAWKKKNLLATAEQAWSLCLRTCPVDPPGPGNAEASPAASSHPVLIQGVPGNAFNAEPTAAQRRKASCLRAHSKQAVQGTSAGVSECLTEEAGAAGATGRSFGRMETACTSRPWFPHFLRKRVFPTTHPTAPNRTGVGAAHPGFSEDTDPVANGMDMWQCPGPKALSGEMR